MTTPRPISRREFARLAAAAAALPPLVPSPLDRLRSRTAGLARGSLVPPGAPVSPGAGPLSPAWPGYDQAIVIDCLATPGPFNVPNMFAAPYTAAMVANARASGITAVNVTLGAGDNGTAAFVNTVRGIAFAERELEAHGDAFLKVRTAADIARARASGRLGLIYGFQDATMFEDDAGRVDLFHQLGVRICQLTYNVRNLVGDGCLEPANGGLSAFGRRVVARMNAAGMLVDLSHVGERTTLDAIAASTRPVAVTHSGCKAVNDVPRNKTDDQLRRLAAKGGVVGIYMMPFLRGSGQPGPDDFVRHVEHAVNTCGEDHVGVGSDLSITPLDLTPEFRALHAGFVRQRRAAGISAPGEAEDVFNYVPEFNTPRRMELVADALARKGHGSARILKILGANWQRLFGEVWA
ncbi:MAG: membrane dipeptidase [Gemmatimonadetes bacterium]|nr:membrane dipeptidase [Gemmatimonadota bacterium]